MGLDAEWFAAIKSYDVRLVDGYGTIPRKKFDHATKLKDFKPELTDELKAKPCVMCGSPRGEAGLTDAFCQPCKDEADACV